MNLPESTLGLLALWLIPGLGPKRIRNLMKYFGDVSNIFSASDDALSQALGGRYKIISKIRKALDSESLKKELSALQRHNVKVVDCTRKEYPELLRHIYDKPPVIYLRGEIDFNRGTPIAVVGSRKASFAGKSICRKLIEKLALLNPDTVIVSGMALGIDSVAHRAALDNGLKTIAVLAGGLSGIYPYQNKGLSEEICLNGTLITEFPINAKPVAAHFPLRNRIISGLSLGSIIVEAGERSGACITAAYALEQNRELFAVPGPPDSSFYKGTNRLIQKSQAKLTMDAEDILEEILPSLPVPSQKDSPASPKSDKIDLSQAEKNILEMLIENGDTHQEILLNKLKMPASSLLAALTTLEVKGLIAAKPGAIYQALK